MVLLILLLLSSIATPLSQRRQTKNPRNPSSQSSSSSCLTEKNNTSRQWRAVQEGKRSFKKAKVTPLFTLERKNTADWMVHVRNRCQTKPEPSLNPFPQTDPKLHPLSRESHQQQRKNGVWEWFLLIKALRSGVCFSGDGRWTVLGTTLWFVGGTMSWRLMDWKMETTLVFGLSGAEESSVLPLLLSVFFFTGIDRGEWGWFPTWSNLQALDEVNSLW